MMWAYLAVLLLSSCESAQYQEQEILMAVTPAPSTAKIRSEERAEKTAPTVSRADVRWKWKSLQNLLRDRSLTVKDLQELRPDAVGIEEAVETGDPLNVSIRIADLRATVQSQGQGAAFWETRVQALRKKVSARSLRKDMKEEFSERLDAVERLIEEGKIDMAKKILSRIQADLNSVDDPLPVLENENE